MIRNNFRCDDCDHEFNESRFVIHTDGTIKTKTGSKLACPKCHSTNTMYIPNEGPITCTFGKFASASDTEKKRMLDVRAHKHFEKRGREQKDHMMKTYKGNITAGDV